MIDFNEGIFYNEKESLVFSKEEMELLKEIHDIHIIPDEDDEIKEEEMIPKSVAEQEKNKYIIYGALISAAILILFLVTLKVGIVSKIETEKNDSRKKRK